MLRGQSKKDKVHADSPTVSGQESFVEDKKKSKSSSKTLKLFVVILLCTLGAAAYWFFAAAPSQGDGESNERPPREPRERRPVPRRPDLPRRGEPGRPRREPREAKRRTVVRQRGVLNSVALNLCLDQEHETVGNLIECRGAKKYTYHLNNLILFDRKYCVEVFKIGENQGELRVGECVRDKVEQHWRFNPLTGNIMNGLGGCLSVTSHNVKAVLPGNTEALPSVLVSKCNEESRLQIWEFGQRRPREPLTERPPRPNRGRERPPPRRPRPPLPERPPSRGAERPRRGRPDPRGRPERPPRSRPERPASDRPERPERAPAERHPRGRPERPESARAERPPRP